MARKIELVNSLLNNIKAEITHVDAKVALEYAIPQVSPITYVCPVVSIHLDLDSKNRLLSDIIAITEGVTVEITKNFFETVSIVNEIVALGTTKNISDAITPADVIALGMFMPVPENVVASDQILAHADTLINDSLLGSHAILQGGSQEIVDNITIRLN